MPALILLSVWGIGPIVVIFLAGLQDVPRELYEAARLDGAGPFRLVRDVTIPDALAGDPLQPDHRHDRCPAGVRPALRHLRRRERQPGGPLNSVLVYSVQLYTVAFQQFRMGYAAAMAWILFVIIFTLSLLAIRFSNRFVHYE